MKLHRGEEATKEFAKGLDGIKFYTVTAAVDSDGDLIGNAFFEGDALKDKKLSESTLHRCDLLANTLTSALPMLFGLVNSVGRDEPEVEEKPEEVPAAVEKHADHDCRDHVNPFELIRAQLTGQMEVLDIKIVMTRDGQLAAQSAGDLTLVNILIPEQLEEAKKLVNDVVLAVSRTLKNIPGYSEDASGTFIRGEAVNEELRNHVEGTEFPTGDDAVIGGE
jgi:hypothetical protein